MPTGDRGRSTPIPGPETCPSPWVPAGATRLQPLRRRAVCATPSSFAFGNSRRWLIHRPEPHGDELQQLLQFFPWECVGSGFDFGQCAHGKRLSATHNPGKTTFPAEMAARQNTWRNKSSAPHAMNFIRLAANTTIFSNSQPWLQRWMLVSP